MAAAEEDLLAMNDLGDMVKYFATEVPNWPVERLQASFPLPPFSHNGAATHCLPGAGVASEG